MTTSPPTPAPGLPSASCPTPGRTSETPSAGYEGFARRSVSLPPSVRPLSVLVAQRSARRRARLRAPAETVAVLRGDHKGALGVVVLRRRLTADVQLADGLLVTVALADIEVCR